MKTNILPKFLPLAAAILLATSCSKDGDNDNNFVNTPEPTSTEVVTIDDSAEGVPFSIQVVTDNSLSKIGYSDAGGDGAVTPVFDDKDLEKGNELKMTIKNGSTTIGTLTLQDKAGIFSGPLDPEPSVGADLTAEIIVSGTETTSTISIEDLMENCGHTYTGGFKYKVDEQVWLDDDKSYIEIEMSPLQHKLDIKFGDGEKTEYALKDNGKVWFAVAPGTTMTLNFLSKTATDAGKIYTIRRTGFVDLGITSGNLWADKNIGATQPWESGDYFAWGEIVPYYKDGDATTENPSDWRTIEGRTITGYNWETYSGFDGNISGGSFTKYYNGGTTVLAFADDVAYQRDNKTVMPKLIEFQQLGDQCYWVWSDDYNGATGFIVYKAKDSDHKGKIMYQESGDDYTSQYNVSEDPHIFLPSGGYRKEKVLNYNTNGYYWSSSLDGNSSARGSAWYFRSNRAGRASDERFHGKSVRPIRRSN